MTLSLRVIENEVENRLARAEIPLARPSQNSSAKLAAQSGQTVQINRLEKLEEANRNKDEFLGMLAHELRNPLAAISMAVEVLRQRPPNVDPEQVCDVISRQTLQMLHLVDDLMDVSRIAHGKVRIQKIPVVLNPLIRQAIEAVQPILNTHKQQLTVSLPPRPVKLLADPVRLVEVFTNLLNNAAKYTDEGGQILLMAAEENDEVVVEFHDTGIGIPMEMLPRIFDPFTQVIGAQNRSEGGIGIGLAMVAHLVRLHGGTVQVFSDGPGHGSRFVVHLPPLHSLDTEDYAAEGPDHPPAESGSHCVVGMSDE